VADGAAEAEDALPTPSVNPRTGVRWYRDVSYVEGPHADPAKHRLDLYLPKHGDWMAGRPLVIWIHGGGWVIGDKDDGLGVYGRYCRNLAERGIAAANVSYRLSPQVSHPGHVEDVAAATAWLVERAGQFGYNADHVFVSGHSAGGHLAMLLGVDGRFLREAGVDPTCIAGVIPSSGVYDLEPLFGRRVSPLSAFNRDTAEDASPVSHVDPKDPPTLFIVEEFGGYMRGQVKTMSEALDEAGRPWTLVEVDDSHHITMLADLVDDDGVHLTSTVRFIREVLTMDEENAAARKSSDSEE